MGNTGNIVISCHFYINFITGILSGSYVQRTDVDQWNLSHIELNCAALDFTN